jgi:hypothetical protein
VYVHFLQGHRKLLPALFVLQRFQPSATMDSKELVL